MTNHQDRLRGRLFRRPDRARDRVGREGRPRTISASNAWPNARSHWRRGEKMRDPSAGFDPLLTARMEAVLRACRARASASSPTWAPRTRWPRRRRQQRSRVAWASAGFASPRSRGTTCWTRCATGDYALLERPAPSLRSGPASVSANAYLGVGADRPGATRRRGRGHHRPRRRSGAVPGPSRPRVRLGDGRLGPARSRHGRRPSAGMRRPDHRRLLCRSRLQGRPRSCPARFSDRRGERGRLGSHNQGRGLGRPDQRRQLQGATAVRVARPDSVSAARRDSGFFRSAPCGGRA